MNKERISIGVVLTVLLLLVGCSGNIEQPIFGLPDSVTVTTLEAIQGQRGYLFELSGGDTTGTTSEVVVGIADRNVSPHPFYVLIRHTSAVETPKDTARRLLSGATQVGFARETPEGYVLLGVKDIQIDIHLEQNPMTSSHILYLFFTTKRGYKVYFPVCLSFDQKAYLKFWEIVNAGPKVIDGSIGDPPQDFVDWLQQTPAGPAPAYITEARFINLPEELGADTEPDIAVVRKQQAELVRSVYGDDYQSDRNLHWALRIVDKIDEGFRQTWLGYVADRNLDTLRMARDTIQRKETGLSYFTTNFTWFTLVLDIYEPIVGSLPSTRYGIIVEYLRLHFAHPSADKDELLDLFTQSVRNGMIITTNPWYVQ